MAWHVIVRVCRRALHTAKYMECKSASELNLKGEILLLVGVFSTGMLTLKSCLGHFSTSKIRLLRAIIKEKGSHLTIM